MTSLSPVVAPAEEKNKFLAEARSNRDATADNFKNVNNVTSHLYKKEFRKEKKDEENCLNHTPPFVTITAPPSLLACRQMSGFILESTCILV